MLALSDPIKDAAVPEMRASLWLARKKIFGPVKN
jgi:hypothetical protein